MDGPGARAAGGKRGGWWVDRACGRKKEHPTATPAPPSPSPVVPAGQHAILQPPLRQGRKPVRALVARGGPRRARAPDDDGRAQHGERVGLGRVQVGDQTHGVPPLAPGERGRGVVGREPRRRRCRDAGARRRHVLPPPAHPLRPRPHPLAHSRSECRPPRARRGGPRTRWRRLRPRPGGEGWDAGAARAPGQGACPGPWLGGRGGRASKGGRWARVCTHDDGRRPRTPRHPFPISLGGRHRPHSTATAVRTRWTPCRPTPRPMRPSLSATPPTARPPPPTCPS